MRKLIAIFFLLLLLSHQAMAVILRAGPEPIFMEVHMAPKEAYVNSQVVYTVQLFYAFNELRGQLIPPPLNNIMFKPMGEDAQYQSQTYSQLYNVVERHYIFATPGIGTFQIPGMTFEGVAPRVVEVPGSFPMVTNASLKLSAAALTLKVKALPPGAVFASKQVKLTRQWEKPGSWQVGQPMTRTVILQAQGMSGEQLPEFSKNFPSTVSPYAEPPMLKTALVDETTWGARTEKISFIPNAEGALVLPAMQIAWLNTDTQAIEQATLPSETFHILAGTNTPVAPLSGAKERLVSAPLKTAPYRGLLFLMIGFLFLFGILGGLFFWRRHFSSQSKTAQLLQQACQSNQPKIIQAALLEWARSQWGYTHIHSLEDIPRAEITAELRAVMIELDVLLYRNAQAHCDGTRIWQILQAQFKMKRGGLIRVSKKAELPPLY
jgi:hypothetical protein